MARDIVIASKKYLLKPSLRTSELDLIVAEFKKTKSIVDELEKHIERLQQQLDVLREKERKL